MRPPDSDGDLPQLRRVAFIGTGVMGRSMAGHLLAAGHGVTVHTRTRERAAELLGRGALWAADPADAAEGADVAVSMVGLPADVREVHLGTRGTLAAKRPPSVIIDMTTSSPALAVEIAHAAARRGCAALDAPVSGGDIGARNATLSIMVGGDSAACTRARTLFSLMGKTIVHHGGPGAGQYAKLVNQVLVAASMVGVSEALAFAGAAGLDPHKVLESVSPGAAGSWTLSNLAPRILKGDMAPGFRVEHLVKDLRIASEEARARGLSLPGLELADRLYEALRASGGGALGTQALAPFVAKRACGSATSAPVVAERADSGSVSAL
jgi:3-hydroxyisobutyrate dehydrogenase